jgi:hypothetical protein
MTLSSFIDINSNIKERGKEIKIISSNGIDEYIAIVLNDIDNTKQDKGKGNYKRHRQHKYYERNKQKLSQYFHDYYSLNRKDILQKKKEYKKKPHVKERIADYQKAYYQNHKVELNSKNKERYRNRKNNK